MRGRPKLVWLVTVRTNDAKGCHIYRVCETRALALQVKGKVEQELTKIHGGHWAQIISEHWVNVTSFPIVRSLHTALESVHV